MKFPILFLFASLLFISCGGDGEQAAKDTSSEANKKSASDYDPNRGIGKHSDLDLPDHIDTDLVNRGQGIVGTKCASCHKMTTERLVGPGLKGVTERRTPVWLMNFITDPDPMISVDPDLQEQLELCLVRMPNQNVSDDEARGIIEFFRDNDSK
jgi:hypothetical protein